MTTDTIPAVSDDQHLIWSNHHKAWWGPDGRGYYKDLTRAGRYAIPDTTRWLGRGCGCCQVPELVIPADKVTGKSDRSIRGVIAAATRAVVKSGRANRYYGQ